ncbi:hypothetical protein CONLIGDRAFT_646812 [Coniochaeta ligniaria NRRL 30616]|uniref:Amidase domain-containing protein n=1 Tax=Coniochaeta ligniaria NRRL 30616 TaxID=1408157 RepID=A0A1J7IHB8_9PEZI|nr:hypothetical protein CONLIGDRAFT_646812 [Coniochaeta ligniaria NRRL 30616]
MARSARDVAAASEILLNPDARSRLPEDGYASFLTGSVKGLKIGFVDPAIWRFPPDLWVPSEEAKNQHSQGAGVPYPVTLPLPNELNIGNDYAPFIVNLFESAATAKEFFDEYVDPKSPVRDLSGLVDFNKAHPAKCLPKGRVTIPFPLSLRAPSLPGPYLITDDILSRRAGSILACEGRRRKAITRSKAKTLDDNGLDLVIAPMDSPACSLSTASGYPIANVHLGRYYLKGELSRPFGLAVFARPEQEGAILRFMSAYKASFPTRPIPERLAGVTGSLFF